MRAFIFTHAPDYPLAGLATAALGRIDIPVTWVIDAGEAAPDSPATLVRTSTPRKGNLNGTAWVITQLETMLAHAGESEWVIKVDSDTLVLRREWLDAASNRFDAVGTNSGGRALFGCCYALKASILPRLIELAKQRAENGIRAEDLIVSELLDTAGVPTLRYLHDHVRGVCGFWKARESVERLINDYHMVCFQRPSMSKLGQERVEVMEAMREASEHFSNHEPVPDDTPVNILIPVHRKGGKFKNNTELRYTVRSIRENFQGEFKIWIVAREMPLGFEDCGFIYDGGAGLKTALVKAADAHPEGFFWWYDDSVLLKPQTAADLKVTIACRKWSKSSTGWSCSLTKVRERLEAEGYKAWDYSRPHGPYWFTKAMVDEGFADWPGMESKFPWETWILSKHNWPRRHGNYRQYYGAFRSEPGPNDVLLNFNDAGCTPELLAFLEKRFPEKATLFDAIEVHTIRFGNPWWLRLCAPTLDSWCQRHGHPLKVWSQEDINPEYPDPKFCVIDMLRGFLAGTAEWCMYVDADVYVAEDAPRAPSLLPGFWIREDLPGSGPAQFHKWCRSHRIPITGWTYRNAGIWICDRASASALLAEAKPPYLVGCMEQHQFNCWLNQAADKGLHVGFLAAAWNAWAFEEAKGAFYHIAGKRKVKRLEMFRKNGRIPMDRPAPPIDFTPAFDFEPYRFAMCNSTAPMDEMHIHMLREALRKGSPDQVAVEIGSWRGASTSAFIDAINCGEIGHLHIFETNPKPELRQVIAMCRNPERITLHTKPSWDIEVSVKSADFVFIDGNHKWPALADTLQALAWGAHTICMHDTHAWPEVHECWGAHTAANILKRTVGRSFIEDREDRPGTLTRRGFMISTRND